MARMMLALMLYFLIVASYPVKGLLEVYEDMVEGLLMLQVFLAEDPEIEYLFCGAPSDSDTRLLFCNDLFCLWLESVQDDLQHDLPNLVADCDQDVNHCFSSGLD